MIIGPYFRYPTLAYLVSMIVVFCMPLSHVWALDDYQAGKRALSKGETGKARRLLERALASFPESTHVKIAYAKLAPCSSAIKIYKEIAANRTAPSPVRAEAYYRLGDYYAALEQYTNAAANYKDASRLDKNPVYRHAWAFASAQAGDLGAAKSLWHAMVLEYNGETAVMAQYHTSSMYLKNGEISEAYAQAIQSGSARDNDRWSVPFTAVKYACAMRLGLTDKAKEYSEQLRRVTGTLLEHEYLQQIVARENVLIEISQPSDTANSSDVVTAIEKRIGYALQVGAFGSMENASKLADKLKKTYDHVVIVPVVLGEQVMYRVRIGTFGTREEAESFGTERLAKSGIGFRVVEE